MNQEKSSPLAKSVISALFAALISAGAYIAIPLGPVPFVLQNFFVILTALLLGPAGALLSVSLYLLLGAIGLPVFAGGTGGFAHFFGPTGGYLLSYLPAALLGSLAANAGRKLRGGIARGAVNTAAALICAGTVYLVGVPWLMKTTGMSRGAGLAAGFYPFIIGDLIKISVAVAVAVPLRERIDEMLYGT
jgi:biotin transport system substrate-specific component